MSQLDLSLKPPLKNPPETDWPEWTSEGKVLADMIRKCGLQPKTVAIEVGVDPAILSKVQTGGARLSEAHMNALMDVCGSEAWLHYWLLKRNYDPRVLRQLETELQRENRNLRERLEKLEQEREIEIRLFTKLRTAA